MSLTSERSLSDSAEHKQSDASTRPKPSPRPTKRKRNDGADYLNVVAVDSGKRKTPKNSEVFKSDENNNLDLERGLNLAIGKLDGRLLADYIAKRMKRFFPDLSLVELEDRCISGTF